VAPSSYATEVLEHSFTGPALKVPKAVKEHDMVKAFEESKEVTKPELPKVDPLSVPAETPLEFTYFKGAKARGHAVRIALHASKLPWKDTSVTFEEYGAAKKEGKFATGLPLLKLPSGKELVQSMAIARFAGKQGDSGLYPDDPFKAAVVDAICDACQDFMGQMPGGADLEEKKKNRAAYMEGKGKVFLDQISAVAEKSDGPFFLGSQLTLADLVVTFFIVDGCESGMWDGVEKDAVQKWTKLCELAKAGKDHEIVKAYEASTEAGDKKEEEKKEAET